MKKIQTITKSGQILNKRPYGRFFNCSFNLPDITNGKLPISVGANYLIGTYTDGALPNITGTGKVDVGGLANGDSTTGAIYIDGTRTGLYGSGQTIIGHIGFDASRSNAIYGSDTKVVPSGIAMHYCIKY